MRELPRAPGGLQHRDARAGRDRAAAVHVQRPQGRRAALPGQREQRPGRRQARTTTGGPSSVQVEPRADLKLGLDVSRAAPHRARARRSSRPSATPPPGRARHAAAARHREGTRASSACLSGCSALATGDLPARDGRAGGDGDALDTAALDDPRRTYSLVGGVTWARRDANPADNQAQTLLTTLSATSVVSLARLIRGVPRAGKCVHQAAAEHARARRNRLRRARTCTSRASACATSSDARRARPCTSAGCPAGPTPCARRSSCVDKRRMIGQRLVVPCSPALRAARSAAPAERARRFLESPAYGAPREGQLGHVRRLRHAHRLGGRDQRRLPGRVPA